MLRLAIEQALDGPELSFLLRRALLDARAALRSDLHGLASTELGLVDVTTQTPGEPLPAAPVDELRPARVNGATERLRSTAHGFRGDKYRELFERAIANGWRWEKTGGGHVRLYAPGGETVVLSQSAQAGRGHGFANIRAAAKRAGLNVDGL